MPYSSNDELPKSVRNNLPEHAQAIYRKAFNRALAQYQQEERAHKVAWSAVEQEYEKTASGDWGKKSS